MNIYEKLSSIQSGLVTPKAKKNSFGNYNYRTCEDIFEGLKPLLSKYKCAVKLKNDIEIIHDIVWRKSTVELIDAESESIISTHTYTQEELSKKGMSVAQCSGSTASYSDKYCLNKLFAIDDTKDPDGNEQPINQSVNVKTKKQVIDLSADKDDLLKFISRTGKEVTVEVEKWVDTATYSQIKKETNRVKKELGIK